MALQFWILYCRFVDRGSGIFRTTLLGLELVACGLWLAACGLPPDYTMNSTGTKSETLCDDLGAQALQLVQLQDPFNCSFI